MSDRIIVTAIGSRPTMETWIEFFGGVQVWRNLNLSTPGAGPIFTPAYTLPDTKDADPYPKPSWSVGRGEIVTDISRFRFVKSYSQAARFRVAVRMGGNGLVSKLTDGSSRRVHRSLNAHPGAVYRFDYETQECIVEVPEYED